MRNYQATAVHILSAFALPMSYELASAEVRSPARENTYAYFGGSAI